MVEKIIGIASSFKFLFGVWIKQLQSVFTIFDHMFKKSIILGLILNQIVVSHQSWAAAHFKKDIILRDAETEKVLKSFAEPIFKAAGLDPKKLQFVIINNSELNAFATSYYTIALYSGLIQKAKNAQEVIGVIAHETGHIAGGHLARIEAVMKKASLMGMAAAALGVLAGVTSRNGDLTSALVVGGFDTSYKNMFHYSRGQEATADQAAVRFLNALSWPSEGLYSFMEVLSHQELLSADQQDPYNRTHPISSDRMIFFKHSIETNPKACSLPKNFEADFLIIQAKLNGYLNPPGQTLLDYSEKDTSTKSRYARAIAFYRNNQSEKALILLQSLINEYSQNPYFYELRGQILFDSGNIELATKAFQKSNQLLPNEPLIQIMLAECLLSGENKNQGALDQACQLLQKANQTEIDNPSIWHMLAIIYGRQQNIGMAALCLAEEYLCIHEYQLALNQAKRALKHLKDQKKHVRAFDIIRLTEDELK